MTAAGAEMSTPQRHTFRCPVCGGRERELQEWAGAQRLWRCNDCGAVHTADYDDPAEIYRAGYHSGQTGYHLDTGSVGFQAYLRQVNRRRLDQLDAVARPPGTLFDVGCGAGEFLAAARDRGWQAAGIEPVADVVAAARKVGLNVRAGRLEDVDPGEQYDVVTALHVVEHVPDVDATLRQLVQLVRPGGHLVLEVPNWRSLHRRRTGARWPLLAPGEHITHFSPQVLSDAVRRAGATPQLVRTPSWVGPPQAISQAWLDLGLPATPRLRHLLSARALRAPMEAPTPSRLGWRLLRGVDLGLARSHVGMVVWLAARRPTSG